MFSLLPYDELRSFVKINSPNPNDALNILKESPVLQGEGFVKAEISLLCGGSDHLMRFPVYGKNCTHVDVSSKFNTLTNSVSNYLALCEEFPLLQISSGCVPCVGCNVQMIRR